MADTNPDLSLYLPSDTDDSQPLERLPSERLPTVRDREGRTPGAPRGRGKQLEAVLESQGMSEAADILEDMLKTPVKPDKTPRDEKAAAEEERAVANVLKQVVVNIAPDGGDVGAGHEEEAKQEAIISANEPKYVILKSLIDYFIGLNIFYRGARHLSMAWSTFSSLWSMIPKYSA